MLLFSGRECRVKTEEGSKKKNREGKKRDCIPLDRNMSFVFDHY